MMLGEHEGPKPRIHRRSRLLIAAYCALGGAIAGMLLGWGIDWTVGTALMAVLLAVGEIVVQVRSRSTSA